MDSVLILLFSIVIQSCVARSHSKMKRNTKKETSNIFVVFVCSFPRQSPVLIDVVKPINYIEEGKDSREDHP